MTGAGASHRIGRSFPARHLPPQSGGADPLGLLPGDPRRDGVWADRGVSGRTLPRTDPLRLNVDAVSSRQWLVGGCVPFIGTAIAQATGISLSALLHPMAIAAIGIIVSYVFIREPTHKIGIRDEVGGSAPPLVPDQP
jgi:hypothetical protein